ncbi:MAG: response regulator [Chloroflexota bacterium]|nr:response regulator [Chloroflexota bacterium]MDE3192674.1 response regulator [Chloroflexota bacterium]
MGGGDARRVLVVDDDDAIRQLLVDLLSDAGYRVEEARGGREALEKVRDGGRPDVILLDKLMPDGDGTMFAETYARLPGRHAPIVGLCASRDGEQWATRIGAVAHVVKPFDIEHLLSIIAAQVPAA